MGPVKCSKLYALLNDALSISHQKASEVYAAHDHKTWAVVANLAVPLENHAFITFLLSKDGFAEQLTITHNNLLFLAFNHDKPSVIKVLLDHPVLEHHFISNLSFHLPSIIQKLSLPTIQWLMSSDTLKAYLVNHVTEIITYAFNRDNLEIFTCLFEQVRSQVENQLSVQWILNLATHKSFNIFKFLVNEQKFTKAAIENDNQYIRHIIQAGKDTKLKHLLAKQSISDAIAADPSLMDHAILMNRCPIVKILASITALKLSLSYKHLCMAIRLKNISTVEYLLSLNTIKNKITSEKYLALRLASELASSEILLMVLQHHSDASIPMSIFSKIYRRKDNQPLKQQILTLLFNRPLCILGSCYHAEKVQAANAWLTHWGISNYPYSGRITSYRWAEFLFTQMIRSTQPKVSAIILLTLKEMAEHHQNRIAEKLVDDNDESAMDKSLVSQSARHFSAAIEPYYKKLFVDSGGTLGIEKKIKESIIDKLIENMEPAMSAQLILKKPRILENDKEAMDWLYDHCLDTTDVYQTCWRAYDNESPTYHFANLLTPPKPDAENDDIYNIPETGVEESFKLKRGSDIIRERACYFYLVATDERLSKDRGMTATGAMTPSEQEVALHGFFAIIAELRRSNNEIDEQNPENYDSPSCFPGCITHLAGVAKFNPHILPMNLMLAQSFETYFRQASERLIALALLKCCSEKDVNELLDAMTLLTHANAWDMIKKPWLIDCPSLSRGVDDVDDHPYDERMLKKRIDVISTYLIPEDMHSDYKKQQPTMLREFITQDEHIFLFDLIADLGRGAQSTMIHRLAQARITALKLSNENPAATTTSTQTRVEKHTLDHPELPEAKRQHETNCITN